MTPEERRIYQMHYFDLGDLVEIDDSGVMGEVAGLRVEEGREDSFLVKYHDTCGNPKREWWPASALEDAPDTSNVACLACARAEREARNATKH
ncbi:MAG: hypothetical protein WBB98_04910 [Xanthobacteraceae bacterium]